MYVEKFVVIGILSQFTVEECMKKQLMLFVSAPKYWPAEHLSLSIALNILTHINIGNLTSHNVGNYLVHYYFKIDR